jgi:hypothetical protein
LPFASGADAATFADSPFEVHFGAGSRASSFAGGLGMEIAFFGTATLFCGGGAAETAQPVMPKQSATHPASREKI